MKTVRLRTFLRYASSFIAPIVVGLILPSTIIYFEQGAAGRPLLNANRAGLMVGLALAVAGLALFIMAVRMFILIGNGTIMPWDPTRKLITSSLFAHVRNPVILSLLIYLVGLSLVFASKYVLLLAAIFFVVNTLYFIYSEEPGLEKRFGAEYVEYKRSVPRWIPRRKPWKPE